MLLVGMSCVSPILSCYLVVDSLIGIENLKANYWFRDGVMLSGVLNYLAVSPFLLPSVRKRSAEYALLMVLLVTTVAFFGYKFFTLAILGV